MVDRRINMTLSPKPDPSTTDAPEFDQRRDIQEALAAVAQSLDAAPLEIALHHAMVEALRAANDEVGALAHQIALMTFDEIVAGSTDPAIAALPLYNIATVYYAHGAHTAAKRWYRHALKVHPDLAIAHQNLAAILLAEGRTDEAERHRARAYSLQRVFIEPVSEPRRQLLILCSGRAAGNVPFDTLLGSGTASRIKYAIDCADEAEDAQLPPFDLVFNAIGEPDIAQPLTRRLEKLTQRCGRPVLNRPDVVARTQRHRTAALLAGLDNVVVPPCMRIDDTPKSSTALATRLAEEGLAFPLLMRPLATHGGDGLTRQTSVDALWSAIATLDEPCYLTQYHDFRSADGFYRKYRIVFVDGEPFAYHLAISPHWIVHYVSADMTRHQWKIDEERRFLEDARGVLGEQAMNAIVGIGQRLGLDYCGIDFTLLLDGRVLVFEANATMLVHREDVDGLIAHKNAFVQCIVDAFEQMQIRRTGA
jgi:glutathione synthase/RimK-type ligase-like ATP-grasp enzyme